MCRERVKPRVYPLYRKLQSLVCLANLLPISNGNQGQGAHHYYCVSCISLYGYRLRTKA